jgi:hypothetical protein
LIAEEVAKVDPELVIRDDKGRIDSVRYDELAAMLLNEVQQQQIRMAAQGERNSSQAGEIRYLQQQQIRDRKKKRAELRNLKRELHAATAIV